MKITSAYGAGLQTKLMFGSRANGADVTADISVEYGDLVLATPNDGTNGFEFFIKQTASTLAKFLCFYENGKTYLGGSAGSLSTNAGTDNWSLGGLAGTITENARVPASLPTIKGGTGDYVLGLPNGYISTVHNGVAISIPYFTQPV
jgi:hypothetical protein